MRILVSTIQSPSHFYLAVPLAWAFRSAGHDVLVAVPPRIAEVARNAGLAQVTVGQDQQPTPDRLALLRALYLDDPWPTGWPSRPELLDDAQRTVIGSHAQNTIARAAATTDDLLALARAWRPDLLLHDLACLAGEVVAAAMHIPNVCIHSGDLGLPRFEMSDFRTTPRPGYAALFERYGVPPRTVPTQTLNPSPRSMPLPIAGPTLPARYVAYNGTGSPPRWLYEPRTRPRVCMTWGTTMAAAIGTSVADPYRDAAHALAGQGVEVVVAADPAQVAEFADGPPDIRVVNYVPLHLVLPFCDAVAHHGGATTMLTAVTAGIPQLMITRNPTYECNGVHLAATGAGMHLRFTELSGDPARGAVVADALGALLDRPDHREAARLLRSEACARLTPHALVPELEGLRHDGALSPGEP